MRQITNFFHHIFIPQEKNDYKAKALHTDTLTYYLIFAVILTFFVKSINGNLSNVLGFATDINITKLYDLTNQERAKNGLTSLQYNERLSVAAQKKAQDMFAKGYWAHFAPDGTTPWSFILSSGYQYEFAGENLAKNFMFSDGVVEAWMNSPSHKENILRKDYTDVGYAVVNGVLNNEETTLVVQMFGKPLNSIAINPLAKPIAAETREEVQSPVQQAFSETIVPSIAVTSAINENNAKAPAAAPVILAGQSKPFINLLPTILTSNLVFFVFLLVAIILDFYFAARMNVIRINGKHMAHFIFLGFIVAGIVLTLIKGSIL